MRSTQKGIEYFKSHIELSTKLTSAAIGKLNNGEIKPERIIPYKSHLHSQLLNLGIAKYSSGYSIDALFPNYSMIISTMGESWEDDGSETNPDYLIDDYSKLIWMLSFGILLNVALEEFRRIANIWDQTSRKDWLLEYLISSRIQGRQPVDTLIFPKPYASLKKAVDETDPAKRSAIVKHYLEKEWYKGHKDAYWHDNHKSKHDTFFGYWSFEAAAVVKIAGIDDSSFRDNEYYPKDLL
jgi:hypothetical protein